MTRHQHFAIALMFGAMPFPGVCLAQHNPYVATEQCIVTARQVDPNFDAYYDMDAWHSFGTAQGYFRFKHCLASKEFHTAPNKEP